MNKELLVKKILEHLNQQLEKYKRITDSARQGVVGDEVKQEGKYDTRAIEASYLAGAHAARLEEIKLEIQSTEFLKLRNFNEQDSIDVGAVVGLASDQGGNKKYFLSAMSGGYSVELDGEEIFVISPKSPLGKSLLGASLDEEVQIADKTCCIKEII